MQPAAYLLAVMVTIVSVALVALGLSRARTDGHVEARLAHYGSRAATLTDLELERGFGERVFRPAIGRLARKLASMAPQESLARARRQLELAGNPGRLRALDFIGLRRSLRAGNRRYRLSAVSGPGAGPGSGRAVRGAARVRWGSCCP